MKMKNYIIIIIALLTFTTTKQICAQTDKVYLHNETRLMGKIVYYKPNDSIKIELKNGQILAFSDKEVKKIIMGELKAEKPYNFKERGFYNATYFNTLFGKTSYQYGGGKTQLGIGVQNISGFQFNRWIGAGLGIGLDEYYTASDATVLTIFGEIRGYLTPDNHAFYYSVASGVGFPLKEKMDNILNITGYKGGFMFQPAIGLRFGASAKFNFFADIGTKFQHISYDQITGSENHYKITYQRWILRGGIIF